MEVYLDYVFIENYIMNFLTLFNLLKITGKKVKILKLCIVTIFIASISVIIEYFKLNNIITNLFAINICVYSLMKPYNLKEYIKYVVIYYAINFEMLGVIIATVCITKILIDSITTRITVYAISGIMLYIINKYVIKLINNLVKESKVTYTVYIQNIKFKVFLDTGNGIKDPYYKYDVIIMNEKAYLKKMKKLNNKLGKNSSKKVGIKISTLNKNSNLNGILIDSVSISKENNNIYLGKCIILFTDKIIQNGMYDGIIGMEMYLNKLGGKIL